MCFGGRKNREERKHCLKICLFGFPEVLVIGAATTAVREVVSSSTLIGPFEYEREREGPLNLSARSNSNFKAIFSFFTLLLTAEAQGV